MSGIKIHINGKLTAGASRRSLIFILIMIMVPFLFLHGCGRKGPPVPPKQPAAAAVKDLSLSINGDMVLLNWTVPDEMKETGSGIKEFIVHRGKQKLSNGDCRNCPANFRPVAEVPAEAETAGKGMKYGERVEKGFKYVFKVTAVSRAGTEGGDSNHVEIVY
jgi:predicted small lipoprotein YifL